MSYGEVETALASARVKSAVRLRKRRCPQVFDHEVPGVGIEPTRSFWDLRILSRFEGLNATARNCSRTRTNSLPTRRLAVAGHNRKGPQTPHKTAADGISSGSVCADDATEKPQPGAVFSIPPDTLTLQETQRRVVGRQNDWPRATN
jgi:hypothetical protein